MTISTIDCWKLLLQSGLLSHAECQKLSAQYGRVSGESAGDAKQLLSWLKSIHVVSDYQAELLLAGNSGPFHFASYTVYDQVVQGRLSGVRRARHQSSKHPVMLRFLDGRPSQQNFRFPTDLDHSHLVHFFETVSAENTNFVVFEDLQGASLEERLATNRAGASESCRITSAVAAGVWELHRRGAHHGDIQPANVWIEESGNAKLLYDHARFMDRSEAPLDPDDGKARGDIVSLGRLLYTLATGTAPLVMTPDFSAQVRADPNSPLSSELREAVAHLTSRGSDRPRTAAAVVETLSRMCGDQRPPQSPPSPTFAAYQKALAAGHEEAEGTRDKGASVAPPPAPLVTAGGREELAINTGASGTRTARRPRQRNRQRLPIGIIVGVLAAVAVGLAVGIGVMFLPGEKPVLSTLPGEAIPAETSPEGDPATPATEPQRNLLSVDDGKSLWASPTAGVPLRIDHLPDGAQLILAIRLSELVESGEGGRVLRALGPEFDTLYQGWLEDAGFDPSEVRQVIWGLYGNMGQFPRVAAVVHLAKEFEAAELLKRWNSPAAQPTDGPGALYQGNSSAYYLPASRSQVFVMGDIADLAELAESPTHEPLLRRELATLLKAADSSRTVNLLFAPNFLFTDGRLILEGGDRQAVKPVERFLGDDLKGALVSAHIDDRHLYLEARFLADAARDRTELSNGFRARLDKSPADLEEHMATLNPHPYWRRVAFRVPAMLRYISNQTRIAREGRQVVMNAALPSHGAHNLAFATQMVLAGDGNSTTPLPRPTAPRSVAESLSAKTTLTFEQDSLEFAAQNIVEEFGIQYPGAKLSIRISGADLQLAGITRNQQVRNFSQVNQSLADVLTALVVAANPTANASPQSPEQKLVWVVDPAASGQTAILITTRDGTAGKYELPEVFQLR